MSVQGWKFSSITGEADSLDAVSGGLWTDGDISIVCAGGVLYFYQTSVDSGVAASPPDIVAPATDPGNVRHILQRSPASGGVPAGTVIFLLPGYFTGSLATDEFIPGITNTSAGANAYLNPQGFWVCNGAALNVSGSQFFDGAGRYLPKLTDARFLMGSNVAGAVGGSNTSSHQHAVNIAAFNSQGHSLTSDENGPHDHDQVRWATKTFDLNTGFDTVGATNTITVKTGSSGTGKAHSHLIDPPNTGTGSPTQTENRPSFMSGFYAIKVT